MGKQGFIRINGENKVVKPYFHKNNVLHFSRAQASLYWKKAKGALNINLFSQVRTETILDNEETPKKINATITDLSVCRSPENGIMQSREIFLE